MIRYIVVNVGAHWCVFDAWFNSRYKTDALAICDEQRHARMVCADLNKCHRAWQRRAA